MHGHQQTHAPFHSIWVKTEHINMCPPEKKGIIIQQYISDPDKPVPYTDKTTYTRPKEYMTGDQRFSERDQYVLSFKD